MNRIKEFDMLPSRGYEGTPHDWIDLIYPVLDSVTSEMLNKMSVSPGEVVSKTISINEKIRFMFSRGICEVDGNDWNGNKAKLVGSYVYTLIKDTTTPMDEIVIELSSDEGTVTGTVKLLHMEVFNLD